MRKFFAVIGLMSLFIQPMAAMAQNGYSHRPVQGSVKSQRVYSQPSETEEVLLLPVRLVSGLVQAPIGAIGGMAKRTGDSVEWVNDHTFRKVVHKKQKMTERPGKVLGRGSVMVPVGVVGTAAALPLGVSYGAVEGGYKGFVKGFNWPDDH
ncbi:MAG: hypothetical protein K0Q50_2120 [Vampirovibrio sp.]|jgi:hypothetical protein|nr:hypothetical protein [Vampirovibrio sp.]